MCGCVCACVVFVCVLEMWRQHATVVTWVRRNSGEQKETGIQAFSMVQHTMVLSQCYSVHFTLTKATAS